MNIEAFTLGVVVRVPFYTKHIVRVKWLIHLIRLGLEALNCLYYLLSTELLQA